MTPDTPEQAKARETLREWFVRRPDGLILSAFGEAVTTLRADILAVCEVDPLDRPSVSERAKRTAERVAYQEGWIDRAVIGNAESYAERVAHRFPAYPPAETWVEWTRPSDNVVFRTNGKVWEFSLANGTWAGINARPYWANLDELDEQRATWRAAGGK